MSIPLVQNNEKDSINTSIIAIKRNIERINMLLGLSNSEEIDTSEFVKKSDIVDVVEAGNMNPVTSNAVVPVDEVTSGNMQSVTSNAVAVALNNLEQGYSTLIANEAIPTSAYGTLSINDKKLSDYDFIDFYIGLYENYLFYPRGFTRVPSFMYNSTSGKIFRVDIPLTGSNNENVSFRYNNDTSVDCRAFNTSTTFYARILGEKIFNN